MRKTRIVGPRLYYFRTCALVVVVVHPSREEFAAQMDFRAFARNYNWQRSAWDRLEVIQVGANKVHIAVQFTRYDAAQTPQASFDSLYILQRDAGGGGVSVHVRVLHPDAFGKRRQLST